MSNLEQKRLYEKTGRRAERLAAIYLLFKGYRILARNYRTKSGEIDIIARKKGVIIAVEVKQRLTRGAAHESISGASERRIANALEQYISTRPLYHQFGLRCDAVFFIGAAPSLRRVLHIIDAF